ncbi:hypothetical protein [Burkholderia sola]|uniref:hypothetical protein n=1 Tax=Burkholderia sola TaxID=2843302 RepID=UPI0023DD92D2|nr:hypothetical protein [Burkholderia sola]MDF3084381.1 hypothetical protein [Burkholderia sola]
MKSAVVRCRLPRDKVRKNARDAVCRHHGEAPRLTVGVDRTEHVGNNETLTLGGNRVETIAWRTAAQHGDPVARAGREWVRALVGHRDALSVLEHAMTGFGAAVLGVVALQLYYAQLAVETRRRTVGPLGRAIALLVAGTVGIGMAQLSHTGTQIMIGVFMAGAVWVTFIFRDLWRRLAWEAPRWNIGWVGGVVWVFDDVAWKIYHASATRDPPAIVVAQLVAGLMLLVVTSWAVGRLTQRIRWLQPIPTEGGDVCVPVNSAR